MQMDHHFFFQLVGPGYELSIVLSNCHIWHQRALHTMFMFVKKKFKSKPVWRKQWRQVPTSKPKIYWNLLNLIHNVQWCTSLPEKTKYLLASASFVGTSSILSNTLFIGPSKESLMDPLLRWRRWCFFPSERAKLSKLYNCFPLSLDIILYCKCWKYIDLNWILGPILDIFNSKL